MRAIAARLHNGNLRPSPEVIRDETPYPEEAALCESVL